MEEFCEDIRNGLVGVSLLLLARPQEKILLQMKSENKCRMKKVAELLARSV